METYKKLNMPDNDLELVRLTDFQREMLQKITERARANGEWEYALDFRMDYNDLEFGAYYLNKSVKPILKPLKGHNELESHFNGFRKSRFVLNGGGDTNTVQISTVGDLMCTADLASSKDVLYEEVAPFIFGSDICFANLESTFSDGKVAPMVISSEEGPRVNLAEPQYSTLTDYKGKKYDVLQLCNNHIIDCGTEGISRTLEHLKADGIRQVGLNASEEASHGTTITEKAGLRIGWVSHTTLLNNRSLPKDKPWLVNVTLFDPFEDADLSKIMEQIRYCKAEKCDLVIVSLHWGLEMEFYPHPKEREWAQAFADEGADIIIGQHPHVIQYSEVVHPKYDALKDVPVVYSQGNLTPVLSCAASCLSTIVRFSVNREDSGAKVTEMELLPVTLVRHVSDDETRIELKKVTTLLQMKPELDAEMQNYADQTAEYADMVLGTDWRLQ